MPRARLVKIGDKIHIQTHRVSRKEKLQYMDWDWMPKLEHPVILKEIERTPQPFTIRSTIKYKVSETATPLTRFIASLRSVLKIIYPMITSNSNIATSCPPRDPENIKAVKHKTKEIPAIPFHNLEKLDK